MRDFPAGSDNSDINAKQIIESIRNGSLYEEILDKIERTGELPVAPSTFSVLSTISSGSDTSLSDLSNIVLKDYGLTSKILKLMNSVHFMRFGEVTTISRAILLLGIQNVKNTVVTMSLFENLQKSRAPYFSHLLSRAVYAAIMGVSLAKKLRYPNPEEAFLGSLFCCLGEILAAYYVPRRYEVMRQIIIDKNSDDNEDSQEHALLVAHFYRSIGMKVGRSWGLPGKMVTCMRKVEDGETSSNTDDANLHCVCSLANTVADISEQDMDEEIRQQHVERLFDSFGTHFSFLKDHIKEIRTDAFGSLKSYCSAYNIDFNKTPIGSTKKKMAPSARENLVTEMETDFLSTMELEPGIAEEVQNPEIIFANGLRDVSRALLDSYNLDDIFTIIMETIYRGLRPAGVAKVVLLIRNTRKPIMDVRLALGEPTAILRKWFVVTIGNDDQDVFTIALSRKKELLIKDSASPSVARAIPDWLADSFQGPNFFLVLPIVVTGKAIGAIYVDGPSDAVPKIASSHFHYLRLLCEEAVLAIRKKSGV
jgi:eukaryotic-like serine/threonine-protein kinase